jgi:PTS system nitrogen regulatory IIA component
MKFTRASFLGRKKLMIADTTIINSFMFGLKADNKDQVLHQMARKIGRETGADQAWIASHLLLSEQLEPSGIGGGVAIPHLKSTPLEKPHTLLVKLASPIDFGGLDGKPADLVCAVLSPQTDGVLHLRRLARTTRLFRESFVLEKIRHAGSEHDMADLFDFRDRQVLAA